MGKVSIRTTDGSKFRRAGHVFGPDPVVLDSGDLTPGQLEAIRATPCLEVTEAAAKSKAAPIAPPPPTDDQAPELEDTAPLATSEPEHPHKRRRR